VDVVSADHCFCFDKDGGGGAQDVSGVGAAFSSRVGGVFVCVFVCVCVGGGGSSDGSVTEQGLVEVADLLHKSECLACGCGKWIHACIYRKLLCVLMRSWG
jgi:hypothetical protein